MTGKGSRHEAREGPWTESKGIVLRSMSRPANLPQLFRRHTVILLIAQLFAQSDAKGYQ